MAADHFKWLFTFRVAPLVELTLEENHPNLAFIKDYPTAELISATLVDTYKFSSLDDETEQLEAVVHSVQLEPSKLGRVFRRVEMNLTTSEKIRMPAFQYESNGVQHFCFACPTKVFLTDDPKITFMGYKEND